MPSLPPHLNPEFLKHFVYTIYLNQASKNSQETAVETASQKKHLACALGRQPGRKECSAQHDVPKCPSPGSWTMSRLRKGGHWEGTHRYLTAHCPEQQWKPEPSLADELCGPSILDAGCHHFTHCIPVFLHLVSLAEEKFSLRPQKSPRQHYITLHDQELHGRQTSDFNSQ